jgi:hypothetical protein
MNSEINNKINLNNIKIYKIQTNNFLKINLKTNQFSCRLQLPNLNFLFIAEDRIGGHY